jgi:hypothetical protein
VRFNRLLIALRKQVEGLGFAALLDRYTLPLKAHIEQSQEEAPLRGPSRGKKKPSEEPLSDEQARELQDLLIALSKLESMFDKAGSHEPFVAVPRPSLRVRHPT